MLDRAGWHSLQWPLLGLLGLVLFCLGWSGFTRYAAWHGLPNSVWDNLYLTLQLIPLNSGAISPPVPIELELARFFIPLLAGAATAKVVWDLFREQIRGLRLRGLRGQIVICGLSRKGLLLANEFRRQGHEVVIIERDDENEWLEPCRLGGMFILLGDATDPVLLRQAGVQWASGLFAVCDDDGINAEIAIQAQDQVRDRTGEPLPCLVHVSDPKLCVLMREQEPALERAPFRLELFNVFERGARRILQEYPAWREDQLGAGPAPAILLVGLGRMGENVVLHAARAWRSRVPDPARRLRIQVIDRNALLKIESLHVRYPRLAAACDLIPLQFEIHSPTFERARFLFDDQGQLAVDTVYICVDNDTLGLHAGLTLQRQLQGQDLAMVIRMTEDSGLAKLLAARKNHSGAFQNLYAFGYLNHTCTPDLIYDTPRDRLAQAAYEETLSPRGSASETEAPSDWRDLRPGERQAYYQRVEVIHKLLDAAHYVITPVTEWELPVAPLPGAEVERLACLEFDLCHAGWADSWAALPEDDKETERARVRAIPAFLARAGYQAERALT